MRFWWQNLNEKPGNRLGPPISGRCRLWLTDDINIGLEWNFWSHFCHISTEMDPFEDLTFSFALPPVAIWFHVKSSKFSSFVRQFLEDYEPRRTELSIHDWTLWWKFWQGNLWSTKMPRWRDGNFNILDFFLGKIKYSTRELSSHQVEIPLPERAYPAKIVLFESTWKRPRWFPKHMVRANVDIEIPIPVPGKGENSWDCGDDATYGMTCRSETVEHAIAQVVEDVLRTRSRYGDSHRWEK